MSGHTAEKAQQCGPCSRGQHGACDGNPTVPCHCQHRTETAQILSETAQILSVPNEEAMQHFLDALNVSGLHPELACASSRGASFLAGLTEPDADHVHITVTEADTGVAHCCECSHPGEKANEWDTNRWEPTYPVLALVTEWPNVERVAIEDYIDPWWLSTPSGVPS